MKTEVGEYIVGAYLKLIEHCDFVDYNVRPPGGGLKGLGELDVVGLRFEDQTAFLCEVTTHIDGLLYGTSYDETVAKVHQKYQRQVQYAIEHLSSFQALRYQLWSPVVTPRVASQLTRLSGLELVVNQDYTKKIDELRAIARKTKHDTNNPFFRTLQILEHLRR